MGGATGDGDAVRLFTRRGYDWSAGAKPQYVDWPAK
jgi:ATP-dependent DNA ligase